MVVSLSRRMKYYVKIIIYLALKMDFVLGIFALELNYVNPHVYKHMHICIKRVLLILFDLCLLSAGGLEVRALIFLIPIRIIIKRQIIIKNKKYHYACSGALNKDIIYYTHICIYMYGKSKRSHTAEWVNTAATTAYTYTYIGT